MMMMAHTAAGPPSSRNPPDNLPPFATVRTLRPESGDSGPETRCSLAVRAQKRSLPGTIRSPLGMVGRRMRFRAALGRDEAGLGLDGCFAEERGPTTSFAQ